MTPAVRKGPRSDMEADSLGGEFQSWRGGSLSGPRRRCILPPRLVPAANNGSLSNSARSSNLHEKMAATRSDRKGGRLGPPRSCSGNSVQKDDSSRKNKGRSNRWKKGGRLRPPRFRSGCCQRQASSVLRVSDLAQNLNMAQKKMAAARSSGKGSRPRPP